VFGALRSCYEYSNYLHTILTPAWSILVPPVSIFFPCHLYKTDCHLKNEYTHWHVLYIHSMTKETHCWISCSNCIKEENLYKRYIFTFSNNYCNFHRPQLIFRTKCDV
jgi:hypothetical protein